MKLLELEEKPDPKILFRKIAKAALDGADQTPPLAAPVELYGNDVMPVPSKETIAKQVQALRSGLASVDMGRFTVEPIGNRAWVIVSTKPARTASSPSTPCPTIIISTTRKNRLWSASAPKKPTSWHNPSR